jgi:hypothetical protein
MTGCEQGAPTLHLGTHLHGTTGKVDRCPEADCVILRVRAIQCANRAKNDSVFFQESVFRCYKPDAARQDSATVI